MKFVWLALLAFIFLFVVLWVDSLVSASAEFVGWYSEGALVGDRPAVNFVAGSGITISATDTPASSWVEYTISASSTPHNLLSATHSDTATTDSLLGSLIYGNGTPAWDSLQGNTTTSKLY